MLRHGVDWWRRMADVVVGSVNVSVLRSSGAGHDYEEFGGDRTRMDDGSQRVTVKGRKNVWSFVTSRLNASDASTLETAIVAAPPITCSGDLLGGSFSCAGILLRKERVSFTGTIWYHVHFSLSEV